MSGRLSIRQGQKGDIAKLRWTHRSDSDTWVFASPVGTEVARIESGSRGARLTRVDAPPESAESFAELTERILGVPLDPRALAGWLHGAVPERDATGWHVAIDESQRAGQVELARRITATRGDVVVKLVVDDYRVVGD